MTKYRIRLANGRVIGPFIKSQLFELKSMGHIKGNEEGQIYPTGAWQALTEMEIYAELMDDNRTVIQTSTITPNQDQTFTIDLTKIRQQRNEKEIDALDFENHISPQKEEMTETIKLDNPTPTENVELKLDDNISSYDDVVLELDLGPGDLDAGYEVPEAPEVSADKTLINPVAQQEIEKLRKQAKLAEEKKQAEEKAQAQKSLVVAEEEPIATEHALVEISSPEDATQFITISQVQDELLGHANVEEKNLAKEHRAHQMKSKQEDDEEEETEEENDEDEADQKKKKRVKLLLIVGGLILLYVLFFPEDEKKSRPPFENLPPQIVFPIPFDQAAKQTSQVEFKKGLDLLKRGTYPDIVKAGLNFKAAYENDLENSDALNWLVRTYGEELEFSKEKLVDAQTIFNIIQSKRPFLMKDPNGVIGMNLFYMAIDKPDAAVDVVSKYLKLYPKNVTQDLFATYLQSLMKTGRVDLAKQFFTALSNAQDKSRYTLRALIDYLVLNAETDKALAYANEAIKKNPSLVRFYLIKAELLFKLNRIQEALPLIEASAERNLEYNNHYMAKFLEVNGLYNAKKGDVKKATIFFTKSLELKDSNELRMKLADLSTGGQASHETDKLIQQSKAIKLLYQAQDFYEKKNYELAMSFAAKATDAYQGYIPAELFLSKVQLKLGLTQQGLKTLEGLITKYPENRDVNLALIHAYTSTYKFNDARNRLGIISGTPLRNGWEYASLNAHLFLKMGDPLRAIGWLKTSINLNPLNDHDIFSLAEILLKRANFDAARSLLNKCMELDPINADYRIAYAKMIYETQDDQAAIGYLLSLLSEFGENPKFLSEIAIFYFRAGKVKDFQDYKTKIENLPTRDKSLYEFLIRAALLDERYNEIPALVEKLIEIEPGDLESMMTAGRVLFENGKLVEAARWFKRVQDRLSSYPKVLYYIARIKFLTNDLDGALEDVKRDIKENGETDASLVFLGQIHVEKKDLTNAENYFKKAQKINPNSYDALMGLADLSTMRNNFDLALDLYKRALKQRSDEPVVHKKIGDVYRLLGQGTLAIESYKMYLEMNPEASDKKKIEDYIQLMQ